MKGLYISLDHNISKDMIDDTSALSNGIERKIVNQYRCLSTVSDVEIICPYSSRIHRIHSIVRRLPLSWIRPLKKGLIKQALQVNYIYLRRPWFINGDVFFFLKKIKKKNPLIKVILELPTYFENSNSKKSETNHIHMLPLAIKDQYWMPRICKYVDRIVTFSKDDMIYGIKTIKTCNAIDTNTIKPIKKTTISSDELNLIACSSLAFWHGYDRVIEGIKKYYDEGGKVNIKFHVVGYGEEFEKYVDMQKKYNLNKNVILYGYKSGKELEEIYDKADIALDSMGRHRSGVYYNSSLKGKEYVAKGIPVISGVETELDYDKSFQYYMRIPADDSPLDMNEVIAFFTNIYYSGKERKDIIRDISEYAKKHFSFEKAFSPVLDYISEN